MLFLLFIVAPIVEIFLLIKLGSVIGAGWTIGVCIATGVVGAWLAKAQGIGLLARIRQTVARGEMPARELLDGVLIVAAGLLLCTPGLVSDALGLLLLVPLTRAPIREALIAKFKDRVTVGGAGFGSFGDDPRAGWGGQGGSYGPDDVGPDVEVLPPGSAPQPPKRKPTVVINQD